MSKLISLLSLSFLFSFSPFTSAHDLVAAIQSDDRSPKNVVRDENFRLLCLSRRFKEVNMVVGMVAGMKVDKVAGMPFKVMMHRVRCTAAGASLAEPTSLLSLSRQRGSGPKRVSTELHSALEGFYSQSCFCSLSLQLDKLSLM